MSPITREKRRIRKKRYYLRDREKVLQQQREYYKANSERIQARTKAYYDKNRLECLAKQSEYAKKRRSKITAHARRRRETDENFRLRHVLRGRVSRALHFQAAIKCAKTAELIGCSIQCAKAHIEKKFKPGMSWQNTREWHIDHIIPCAEFDLRDPAQQRLCFHYSNLQPLWALENLQKQAAVHGRIGCTVPIST